MKNIEEYKFSLTTHYAKLGLGKKLKLVHGLTRVSHKSYLVVNIE
jgi:hypothetical protein